MPVNIKAGHSNFFEAGFEVFGHKVSVMFCDDVLHTMSELHPEATPGEAEALTYFYHDRATTEVFFKFEVKPGTVAHEALHVVWNMFTYHGVKNDDENMAYHVGWLVDEISRAQQEAQEAKNEYIRNKELENTWFIPF